MRNAAPILLPSILKIYKPQEHKNDIINTSEILRVYPNPSSNFIIIEWELVSLKNSKISIFDITGNLKNCFRIENNLGYKIINTKEYPSGVYFCRIIDSDNLQETVKFIIKH